MQHNSASHQDAAYNGGAPPRGPAQGAPPPGWMPYGQYAPHMAPQPYMMATSMPGMMGPGMPYAPMMMMRTMPMGGMPSVPRGPPAPAAAVQQGGPRGGTTHTAGKTQEQSATGAQSVSSATPASKKWSCAQCTYLNNASSARCAICSFPFSGSGPPPQHQGGQAQASQATAVQREGSSGHAAPRPPMMYGGPMMMYGGPHPSPYGPGPMPYPVPGQHPSHYPGMMMGPHGYGVYHGAPRAGYTGVVTAHPAASGSLQGLRPPAPHPSMARQLGQTGKGAGQAQAQQARAAKKRQAEEDDADGIVDMNGDDISGASGGRGGGAKVRGRPKGSTKEEMQRRQEEAETAPPRSTRGRKRGRTVHDPTVYDRPTLNKTKNRSGPAGGTSVGVLGSGRGAQRDAPRGKGTAQQSSVDANVAEIAAEEKRLEALKQDVSTIGHITERLAYVTSAAAETSLWPTEEAVHTHEAYMHTARIVDLRPSNPEKPNARIHKPVRAEPLPKPGKHTAAMKWSDVTLLQSFAGVVSPQTYEALAALADAQLQEQHHSTRAKLAPEEMPSTAVVTDGVLTEALTLTMDEALAVGCGVHPALSLLRTVLKDVPSELCAVAQDVFGEDSTAAPEALAVAVNAAVAPLLVPVSNEAASQSARNSPAAPDTPASQRTEVVGAQSSPAAQPLSAVVIDLLDESEEDDGGGASSEAGKSRARKGKGTGKRKRETGAERAAGVSTAQTVMDGQSPVNFTARSSGRNTGGDTQSSLDSRLVPDVLADMAGLSSPPVAQHTDGMPVLIAATRADGDFDAKKVTSVLNFLANDSFVDRPEYLLHMLRNEWRAKEEGKGGGVGSHDISILAGAADTDWRAAERDRAWYEHHSPEAAVTYVLGGPHARDALRGRQDEQWGSVRTANVIQAALPLHPEAKKVPQVQAVVGGYTLVDAPDAATVDAFYTSFTVDRRVALDMTVPQAENSFDFAVARFAGRDFAGEWHTPQMMESGASFAVLAMQASMQLDDAADKNQSGRSSKGGRGHNESRKASIDAMEMDQSLTASEIENEKRSHSCARWSSALSRVVHHAAVSRCNVWRMYNDAFKRLEERIGTGKAETFAGWDGNTALHLELLEDTLVYARLVTQFHDLRTRAADGVHTEAEQRELARAQEAVQRYELAVKCRAVIVKRLQQRTNTLTSARLSWIEADITFKDEANAILAERLALRAAQGKPVRNISADTWGYLELCLGLDDGGENEWEDFYGGRLLLQRGTMAKAAMPRYYTPTTQQKRGQISAQLLKKLDPKAPDRYLIAHSSRLQHWRTGRGRGRYPNFVSRGRGVRGRPRGRGGRKGSMRGAALSDDDSSTEPDEEIVVLPPPDMEDDIEIIEEESGDGDTGAGSKGVGAFTTDKAAGRGGKPKRGRGRPRLSTGPSRPVQPAEEEDDSDSTAGSVNSDLTDGSAFSLDLDWFPMRKRVDSTLSCAWELYPMSSPLEFRFRNPDLPLTTPDYESQYDSYVLAWSRIGEKEEKIIAEQKRAPPTKPVPRPPGSWHWPSTRVWAPEIRTELGRSGGLKVNGRYCWMGLRRRFICSLCWARFGDRAAVIAHVNHLHKSEAMDVEHPAWKVLDGSINLKDSRSLWAVMRRESAKEGGVQGGRRLGRRGGQPSSDMLASMHVKPGFDWSRLEAVAPRSASNSTPRTTAQTGKSSGQGPEAATASTTGPAESNVLGHGQTPVAGGSLKIAQAPQAVAARPSAGASLHVSGTPLMASEEADDDEEEEQRDNEEEEEDHDEVEDWDASTIDERHLPEMDDVDAHGGEGRGSPEGLPSMAGNVHKRARLAADVPGQGPASIVSGNQVHSGRGDGSASSHGPDGDGAQSAKAVSISTSSKTLAWHEGMSMYRTVVLDKTTQKWLCIFLGLHKQSHKHQADAEETHVLCCKRYNHDPRAFIRTGHIMYKDAWKELKGWPGDWIVNYPGLAGMADLQDPDSLAGIPAPKQPTYGSARERTSSAGALAAQQASAASGSQGSSAFNLAKLLPSPLRAEDEDPTGFRAVAVRRKMKALLAAHSLTSEGASASAQSASAAVSSAATSDQPHNSARGASPSPSGRESPILGSDSYDPLVSITNTCRAHGQPPCSTAYAAYKTTHNLKSTVLKQGSAALQSLPRATSVWDDVHAAGSSEQSTDTLPAELADVDPILLRMLLLVDSARLRTSAVDATSSINTDGVKKAVAVVNAKGQAQPEPPTSHTRTPSSSASSATASADAAAAAPAAGSGHDGEGSVVSGSVAATEEEDGDASDGGASRAEGAEAGAGGAKTNKPRKLKPKNLPQYVIGAVSVGNGQATVVRLKEEGQLEWKISEHFEAMHQPARRQRLRDQIVALLDICIHSGKDMPAYVQTGMLEDWQRWRDGYSGSDTYTARLEQKNILSLLSRRAPAKSEPAPPPAAALAPAPAPAPAPAAPAKVPVRPSLVTPAEVLAGMNAETLARQGAFVPEDKLVQMAKVHALRALSQRECAECHCRDGDLKGDGSAAVLLHCKGCYTLRFCGSDCQRRSWGSGHARICSMLDNMRKDGKLEALTQEQGSLPPGSPRLQVPPARSCVFCRAVEGAKVGGSRTVVTTPCLSCEDVRYCSEACAAAHRSTHAADCVRRRAEKRAGFLVGMAHMHGSAGSVISQGGQQLLQRAALQQVLLSAAVSAPATAPASDQAASAAAMRAPQPASVASTVASAAPVPAQAAPSASPPQRTAAAAPSPAVSPATVRICAECERRDGQAGRDGQPVACFPCPRQCGKAWYCSARCEGKNREEHEPVCTH